MNHVGTRTSASNSNPRPTAGESQPKQGERRIGHDAKKNQMRWQEETDLEARMNAEKTTTAEHPFLAGLDKSIMLDGAEERQFEAGDVIFHEGEPADTLYLIESGQVALEATSVGGATKQIQTLGAGEVLGWSWLFPPFAWHFQARAIQPTRAICCDGGHLLVEAEENPAFGYDLMKRVSQLLIQRLQATRKRLVEDEALLHGTATAPAL
jgi:CRP-like cAMP-binding protein